MPLSGEERRASGLAAIREGFAYLKGRRVLQSTFLIDIVAMVFGMPRALFPILAVQQFHGGPEIVGVLFSALAVGALGGALTTGWVGRIRASAGVGASLPPEQVERFSEELHALLAGRGEPDPLTVPHRVWAVAATKP